MGFEITDGRPYRGIFNDKLRWAGHNRGKVRVYREDGSYFYGDPNKYLPRTQYTEEEKKQLKE